MGDPSRRDPRPGPLTRFAGGALSLLLGLTPGSASAADALRDAVASAGWAAPGAALPPAAVPAARPLPPDAAQAAFDYAARLLSAPRPLTGEARRALLEAEIHAPPERRAAVAAWARAVREELGADPDPAPLAAGRLATARASLPALAVALGLARADGAAAAAARPASAAPAVPVAGPDFGARRDDAVVAGRPPLPPALREEAALRERLGQSGDLAGGAGGDAAALDRLLERVAPYLPENSAAAGGWQESRDGAWSSVEAVRRLFSDETALGRSPSEASRAPDLAGTPQERAVEERVARLEALGAQLQAELATRDAAAAMLAAADRGRAAALRERRAGRETLEFRKNFARLAMVMDLSYSLNMLDSADSALAKMQALVDQKFARIAERRRANGEARAGAGRQAGRADEWRREAEEQTREDQERRDDFASLSTRVTDLSRAVAAFRDEVGALLAGIDARDRHRSPNAVAEYERRLALLPELRDKLVSGAADPDGVSSMTLDYLRGQSREVADYRSKLGDADRRIAEAPVEFAGALVIAVPGVPAETVVNPDLATVRALLERRRAHWTAERDDHRELLDAVTRGLDPNLSASVADDFGGARPESFVVWRREQLALAGRLAASSDGLGAQVDALAARLERLAPGAALPRLAGRSADELRDLLPDLLDRLDAAKFPDGDAGFEAKTLKIDISRMVPALGDMTVRRLEAEATAEALEKPISEVLSAARAAFTESVAAFDAVLADIAADEAWLSSGGSGQALIDRKRRLVSEILAPMLVTLQKLLDDTLIPFQQERIADADPDSTKDGYGTLYKEKKKLYERIADGLKKALPWGLASNGAKAYDPGAARAGIAELRADYDEYLEIVTDYQDQMRRRKDPALSETEDLYGEQVPYSLVRRQEVYAAEMRARAARMNALAREVNDALTRIDGLTNGAHRLAARFALPVDLDAEATGTADRLTKMADDRVLQNMATAIKEIADAAQAASAGEELGVGGGGSGIPTGTQPPLDVSNNQKIALLGLEAVKRLVPTTGAAGGDSYAESLARFLFSEALVTTSRDYLRDRIPVFEAFLNRAKTGLDAAVADLDADLAWTGGDLSGGEAVLTRKIGVFRMLAGVTAEGADLFGQKAGWSAEGVNTVARVSDYYDTLGEVYESGDEALDAEEKAAREFADALKKSRDGILEQRRTVTGWLKQLDDPNETALSRVAQNISAIQDRTRAVLETNIEARRAERARDEAVKSVEATIAALEAERTALGRALEPVGDLGRLSPGLARRAEAATRRGPAWLAPSARGGALVVPKSDLERFLSSLFGAITADAAARDIVRLREEILRDPQALARLMPGTSVAQVGEGTDGFYLVYQSEFSTPGGLETSQQVTMGNALNLWGQNISVIGHRFASPPSDGNAPFGDQGVTVRVESLDSDHMVNYLDVTFHKFIQDIPADLTVGSQAQEARMMIFDDFALMVANGKVYFGAAGFADFAATDAGGKPSYYGGNLKSRVKFNEVLTLTGEQTVLFAKDPRRFLQTVNLDFTRLDPSLDETFVIEGRGQDREYQRTRLGVEVDLARALEQKDNFVLDLHWSKVTGTDPISQQALGASILKGFTFDLGGKQTRTTVEAGADFGERTNSGFGRVAFEVPEWGTVVTAQGKLAGNAAAYFAEIRKRTGTNSELALSYGSRYIGLNDRMTVSFESTYTLGELWRAVTGQAAEDLRGGGRLNGFDKALADFFARDDANNPALKELARAFDADTGRRLVVLEIGRLAREIGELKKAGALLDNIRQRAMVGFVSGPVGPGTAELATGGGFQAGTQTELTLTKSQRALMEQKAAVLFSLGLDLEERLLDTAKSWMSATAEIARARWSRDLAAFLAAHAQDPVLRAEAEARVIAAQDELRRASLRYAALTGRGPEEPLPFDGLNANDLRRLMGLIGRELARSDRLGALLSRARKDLAPDAPTSAVLDWVPWIEKFTLSVGAQLPDLMSSQALGVALTVRLPVHDPTKGPTNAALELQAQASILEMAQRLKSSRLRAQSERFAAASWGSRANAANEETKVAADELSDAIRAFRNGLISPGVLREAARRWLGAADDTLTAAAQASLHDAWALLEGGRHSQAPTGLTYAEPATLPQAFDRAVAESAGWEALARRSQAARELMDAADRRVRKVDLDLSVGANITALGVAFIPAFGITGLAVLPVAGVELAPEELRELDVTRRGAEAALYSRLQDKAAADLSFELTRALLDLHYARRAMAELGENDERRAAFLTAQAAVNHLLGRHPGAAVRLSVDPDQAIAALTARLASLDPVAASRDALRSRLEAARAVEVAIDKGLKVERLRLEPISLIGRSLGRLIAALSGDGVPSPELMAIARERVIAAERALEAFDQNLPLIQSRLSQELLRIRSALSSLNGRTDPDSRAALIELSRQESLLKAQLAAWGARPEAFSSKMPSSYQELSSRLREAALRAIPPSFDQDLGAIDGGEFLGVRGSIRWFDHRQTLGGDRVGRQFIEGWVEARLRSPSTPPQALAALARLREARADETRAAQAAAARARADLALARLRFAAAALRHAGGEGLGEATRRRIARDVADAAALLGLPSGAKPEDLLALMPEEGGGDLAEAAARAVEDAEAFDLELLKKTLFTEGLPAELSGRDRLPQLRADLIAERMSSRGFTPLAAVGLFRGQWVTGGFLEAPDPEQVQSALVEVLDDALRRELQAQDRLAALGLLLHTLIASVSEKTRLVAALRLRSVVARRSLLAAVEKVRHRMAAPHEIAEAHAEVSRAQAEFVAAAQALAEDFARLTAELTALGVAPQAYGRALPARAPPAALEPAERSARERLLAWWADKLLEEGFEARQDELLAGVPPSLRAELKVLVGRYRQARTDAKAVISPDFDAARRLELLIKVDLQGRRRLIEGLLSRVLDELQSADPVRGASWSGLMGFLRQEAAAESERGARELLQADAFRQELALAYWSAAKAPPAVDAAVRRLIALDAAIGDARRRALAAWLSKSAGPQDHLLKDKELDALVSALDAFDAELAKTLELPEAARDAAWIRSLGGLFAVRESLERRRARLTHGRGMLTLDASILLGEMRLIALRHDPTETREIEPAAENLAFLRGMKARWLGRTQALPALIALKDKNGEVTWATGADLKALAQAGRIHAIGDKRYAAPLRWAAGTPADGEAALAAGWTLIVEGSDAAKERLAELRLRRDAAAHRAALSRALETAEIIIEGPGLGEAATLSDLRRLEREGRVLYFDAKPDPRTGRRRALPPAAARMLDPRDLDIFVADIPVDPSKFPTREALDESALSVRRASLGKAGTRALIAEATEDMIRAKREGWLRLKLNAYGFALDENRNPSAVYMDEKELSAAAAAARDPKDPRHAWSFFRSSDLSLGLSEDGTVVAVKLGTATVSLGSIPVSRWLSETPWAVETDDQGRLRRIFLSQESMARRAEGWWVEDERGRVWKNTDEAYDPTARPVRWLDPETGLAVRLGRPLVERRVESADDAHAAARRWAYMPGQWDDIVLELPRGIVSVPVEIITGRDPNQHGYLGRTYARRVEGGASRRYGAIGTVARAIDFLGILPDPVQRWFDPSQFPDRVDPRSALNPGESIHEKDPRTAELDLIYGVGALSRAARWAREEREAARADALAAFQGGARRVILETVRGRAGGYAESILESNAGRAALLAAISELGSTLSADDSATLSADPRRGAVDRVVESWSLNLGAAGHEHRLRLYEEALKFASPEEAPELASEIATAEAALNAALAARRAAAAALSDSPLTPGLPGPSSLARRLAGI